MHSLNKDRVAEVAVNSGCFCICFPSIPHRSYKGRDPAGLGSCKRKALRWILWIIVLENLKSHLSAKHSIRIKIQKIVKDKCIDNITPLRRLFQPQRYWTPPHIYNKMSCGFKQCSQSSTEELLEYHCSQPWLYFRGNSQVSKPLNVIIQPLSSPLPFSQQACATPQSLLIRLCWEMSRWMSFLCSWPLGFGKPGMKVSIAPVGF